MLRVLQIESAKPTGIITMRSMIKGVLAAVSLENYLMSLLVSFFSSPVA